MSFLVDFAPLAAFFIAYKMADIYVATAFLIAASTLQLAYYRYSSGKFEKSKVLLFLTIVIFGGLTLSLHSDVFIKWKVTIVCSAFAGAFLLSRFVGARKPLIKRIFMGAGEEMQSVPESKWYFLNNIWAISYLLQAAGNHYFAFYHSQQSWVNYKVWGLTSVNLLMIVFSMFIIAPFLKETVDDKKSIALEPETIDKANESNLNIDQQEDNS